MLRSFPERGNLITWDASFYHSITYDGYSYGKDANNTGFCPLFPWIWRYSHLGVYGICLLNTLIFSAGFTLLCHIIRPKGLQQYIWLSIPSMYISFLPYPEACYFLLITLAIFGILNGKRYLIWASLFLLPLTRMNIVCLVPAFFATELISNDTKNWFKAVKNSVLNYLLPMLAGLGVLVCYQHYTTGVWFAYFIKQSTVWSRVFSIPKLPFQAGPTTLWLNALALFTCFIAFIIIVPKAFQWLRTGLAYKDKPFILSCCYMIVSALLIAFFNPKWGDKDTTNVWGAHRYILASPFFLIFLDRVSNKEYKWQHYLLVAILSNLCWLAFGSYLHIQELAYFNFNTLLVMLFMASGTKLTNRYAIALIAINVLLQIMFMQQFMAGLAID